MDVVPFQRRGINWLALAHQAYRNRHVARNIANNIRAGANSLVNMAKRSWTGTYGPPSKRARHSTYKGRKQYCRRRRYRRRNRLSTTRWRKSRARGRRTLKRRVLILRSSTQRVHDYVASGGVVTSFPSPKINLSATSDWMPRSSTVQELKKCMFDSCDSKYLKKVHVYATDVQIAKFYTKEQTQQVIATPTDSKWYTYSDRYSNETSWPQSLSFIQKNGLASFFRRNQLNYHP